MLIRYAIQRGTPVLLLKDELDCAEATQQAFEFQCDPAPHSQPFSVLQCSSDVGLRRLRLAGRGSRLKGTGTRRQVDTTLIRA